MSNPQRVFALVDCNNFFVSCERVFRPDLKSKPTAVLSNNDGVVVARSNEVKKMGVPMAIPYFKVKKILKEPESALFSANFGLYGDFSRRIVEVLEQAAPYVEVYSVDESFLEVTSLLVDDYQKWGQELSAKVEKWTGIPVSVGIGPSKTIAKAASEYAKKHPEVKGAFSVMKKNYKNQLSQTRLKKVLSWLPIQDVWGVGWRRGPRLSRMGIKTAYDLTQVSDDWALNNMTILGLKTVRELRGESCIPLAKDLVNHPQKSLSSTRSFGKTTRAPHELEASVASFSATVARRLRRQHQLASEMLVFLRSGIKAPIQHNPTIKFTLDYPTADTAEITAAAVAALNQGIKPKHGYKRAGIVVTSLVPVAAQQMPIIDTPTEENLDKRDELMIALDEINKRYGRGALVTARQGIGKKKWHSKREKRSPAYTTSWTEIPTVKAWEFI